MGNCAGTEGGALLKVNRVQSDDDTQSLIHSSVTRKTSWYSEKIIHLICGLAAIQKK